MPDEAAQGAAQAAAQAFLGLLTSMQVPAGRAQGLPQVQGPQQTWQRWVPVFVALAQAVSGAEEPA